MADKPSVGFVGVGNMGWPMAACLVKAGFTVHVNDSRREVLGVEYVDGSVARADDFNAAFQQMTTEVAWGMIWTRPGLDRKTRSMINLTMLAALNRGAEFRLHLRAALTNGVSRDEIKEILLQIGAYCGIPACLEAFRIATEVFKEVDSAKGSD